MNENLYRRFYTAYGYFQAMSEFNLYDSFIEFMDTAYDIFASMGKSYEVKIQEIIDKVWLDDYTLNDDLDFVRIAEEIEEMFRYGNF